jgi:hypothetical protein
MKKPKHLFWLVLLMTLAACNLSYFEEAEFSEFTWNPTLAIPLGELEYTVSELFLELDDQASAIGPGEDNIVTVVYEETVSGESAIEYLSLLDQSFSGGLVFGTAISNSPVQQEIRRVGSFDFDLDTQADERIDSAYLKNGRLDIQLTSGFAQPITYALVLRSLKNNGISIIRQGTLTSFGSRQETVDLNGITALFHLNAEEELVPNQFVLDIAYDIRIPQGGSLSSTTALSFDIGLRELEYSDLFGLLGTDPVEFEIEVLDFTFFDIFTGGEVFFADPRVDFTYFNSLGFPIGIDYSNVGARSKDGTFIRLTGPITEELAVVNAPVLGQLPELVETTHRLDNTNSNIVDIISSQPGSFRVDVSTVANPENVPEQYNFLTDRAVASARATVEIPFNLTMEELVANEQLRFRYGDDLEQANEALLRVIATNDMPMSGDLELQFLNRRGQVIFTVDERPVFGAAEIGPDGRTTGPDITTNDFLFDSEDLRLIENAATVNIVARLNTTDAQSNVPVKFFDDYVLNLTLALQADVELNPSGE